MRRLGRPLLSAASKFSDLLLEAALRPAARRLATKLGLPCHLVHLLLSIEDKRFPWHPGVDPVAIFRALAFNIIIRPRRAHGASTIVQQIYSMAARGNGTYSATIPFKLRQMRHETRDRPFNPVPEMLTSSLLSEYSVFRARHLRP